MERILVEIKSPESTDASRTSHKYLKLTEEGKRHHVLAYVKSKLSRRTYCDQHGLKLSSFKSWIKRYPPKRTSDFIPIITTPQSEPRKNTQRIEIYKGNYKVVLPEIESVAVVISIIRGVISCN
jgi:hypothetical protein